MHNADVQIYCAHRERLRTEFTLVGEGPGRSIPAALRASRPSRIAKWSDGTVRLGWYLAVLATEHYLLSRPDEYPEYAAVGNVERTAEELLLAAKAVDRLCDTAEKYFVGVCGAYQHNEPGFFIRDDVPLDVAAEIDADLVLSDFVDSIAAPFNKEESQDQVYHLYLGFTIVKNYTPELKRNGYDVSGAMIARAVEIVKWMRRHDWTIRNPACGRAVRRGANAFAYAGGLRRAARNISDDHYNPGTRWWHDWLWDLMAEPWHPGYLYSSDNLHMTMVLAALGNGWGPRTTDALMKLAPKHDWYIYPLLNALLFPENRNAAAHRQASLIKSQAQLTEAAATGPAFLAPPGWRSPFRFTHPKHEHQHGEPGGVVTDNRYNGLDYMLLYNLCTMASQDSRRLP